MAIINVDKAPRDIIHYDDDLEDKLSSDQVDEVAEIFQTPLTGSYNWNYLEQDNRIKKLYALGKELNWDADLDINWAMERPKMERDYGPIQHPFADYPPFQNFSDEKKREFNRHMFSANISQFLHGEQGALLVASQIVSCAPTFMAKKYAASQTFDEARHVEAFSYYIQQRVKMMYPINNALKSLLDKILTDERWDLKFIGMQIIIEGLALAAFNSMKATSHDPVLTQMLELIIRDEARHVTFGVNYLEEHVKSLTEEEIEERAEFAFQACVISRERMVSVDVFEYFGWDVEEARMHFLNGEMAQLFRKLLFTRVMPNLKRIGLLTDKIRPKFEELSLLEYEDMPTDADVSWADLSRPLETYRNEAQNSVATNDKAETA